jgi:hypothetical protein
MGGAKGVLGGQKLPESASGERDSLPIEHNGYCALLIHPPETAI